MNTNRILAHRFGLTTSVLVLGLLTSAFGVGGEQPFAAAVLSPQVAVTNAMANPVPGMPAAMDLYQASQNIDLANAPQSWATFNVPAGKRLVVQHVAVSTSANYLGSLVAWGQADSLAGAIALPFEWQPAESSPSWGGQDQQIAIVSQFFAVQVSRGSLPAGALTTAQVHISGYLIPAQ